MIISGTTTFLHPLIMLTNVMYNHVVTVWGLRFERMCLQDKQDHPSGTVEGYNDSKPDPSVWEFDILILTPI